MREVTQKEIDELVAWVGEATMDVLYDDASEWFPEEVIEAAIKTGKLTSNYKDIGMAFSPIVLEVAK